MDMTRAFFTIRIAAETTGLHPQTIRVYERKGLICPKRSSGGTRMYSMHDIELLEEIQELSNAGVGIEGISRILALQARVSELEAEVERLSEENQRLSEQVGTTAIILRTAMPNDITRIS